MIMNETPLMTPEDQRSRLPSFGFLERITPIICDNSIGTVLEELKTGVIIFSLQPGQWILTLGVPWVIVSFDQVGGYRLPRQGNSLL